MGWDVTIQRLPRLYHDGAAVADDSGHAPRLVWESRTLDHAVILGLHLLAECPDDSEIRIFGPAGDLVWRQGETVVGARVRYEGPAS